MGTHELGPQEGGALFILWSARNVFDSSKAYSFRTKVEAQIYLDEYLEKRFQNCFVAAVDSKTSYVTLADMIKNGYEQYTHDMLDKMPIHNDLMH